MHYYLKIFYIQIGYIWQLFQNTEGNLFRIQAVYLLKINFSLYIDSTSLLYQMHSVLEVYDHILLNHLVTERGLNDEELQNNDE